MYASHQRVCLLRPRWSPWIGFLPRLFWQIPKYQRKQTVRGLCAGTCRAAFHPRASATPESLLLGSSLGEGPAKQRQPVYGLSGALMCGTLGFSFIQKGMRPQRAITTSRSPSRRSLREANVPLAIVVDLDQRAMAGGTSLQHGHAAALNSEQLTNSAPRMAGSFLTYSLT